MVLIIKGSDFYLSAHWDGGARTKFYNAAAEKSVRPSEGMAEGGCGGNSAMPERIELSPRHLPEYLEGRTPKKNVLSFLEEIGRAQIRKARNIFLWCPPS